MIDFIQKLPIDIVLQIIPYTYNLQNKNLLNDIINYKETKTKLFELYYKFYNIDIQVQDDQEYKNWLINDIFSYSNNYRPIMYGYIDDFYHIFKRNNYLRSIEQIDKYVSNLKKKEVETQINLFLGLLNIKERKEIINESPVLD